jgi:hypothetical protein
MRVEGHRPGQRQPHEGGAWPHGEPHLSSRATAPQVLARSVGRGDRCCDHDAGRQASAGDHKATQLYLCSRSYARAAARLPAGPDSERLGLTWAMTIEAHSLVFIMGGPIWGVPVNNRKEVIQCLIVLCRGCRLVRPGFSPLSRSAPRKTATLKRSGGPRSTMERPPTGGLSLVRGSALNGC